MPSVLPMPCTLASSTLPAEPAASTGRAVPSAPASASAAAGVLGQAGGEPSVEASMLAAGHALPLGPSMRLPSRRRAA